MSSQEELEALKPVLAQSQQDTEALMVEIKEKLPGVELKRTEVQADASVAEGEAAECLAGKQSVEEDLSVAMPALNAAIKVSLPSLSGGVLNAHGKGYHRTFHQSCCKYETASLLGRVNSLFGPNSSV